MKIILVSNELEVDSAREVSGLDACVMPTDLSALDGKNVLIWFNREDGYREDVDLAVKIVARRAASVHEIAHDEPGVHHPESPTSALFMEMNPETFASWSTPLLRECKPQAVSFRALSVEDETGGFIDDPIVSGKQVAAWHAMELIMTKNNQPAASIENVRRIVASVPRLAEAIWLDEFSGAMMVGGRQLTDAHVRAICCEIHGKLGITSLSPTTISDGLKSYGEANRRHPLREYLLGVEWDRQTRLESFFSKYMGAEDTKFNRAVSRNFFIAMVARVFAPGCKVDNMVILEGAQGKKKSTALEIIGGPWYSACNESVSGKDFYQVLHGKMIAEICELDSFKRAEVTRIKAIVTTRSDRYRPPYGEFVIDQPRSTVLVGTTNKDDYLADETGGRRFWPVRVGKIETDLIARDRDQLFAEAVYLWNNGQSWWDVPEDEAQAIQDSRRNEDAWEEDIRSFLIGRSSELLTSGQISKDCLQIELSRKDLISYRRIAFCMKAIGWKQKTVNGTRYWFKP